MKKFSSIKTSKKIPTTDTCRPWYKYSYKRALENVRAQSSFDTIYLLVAALIF
jgi:hypothetical protein